MKSLRDLLFSINKFVWGPPTLLLLLVTGIILTLRTHFFQIRGMGVAIRSLLSGHDTSDGITPLQSVSAALSGTLGTGNIVGVAGAIALGGPGAVFWMWVSAFFSMIIKYAEIVLSVHYRERLSDGTLAGGTMYVIKNALPHSYRFLATIFALFGVAAAFGVGNLTQINTLTASSVALLREYVLLHPDNEVYIKLAIGTLCAFLLFKALKSDRSTARFCERLIPIAALLYAVITLGAIIKNYRELPRVFAEIFTAAFSPRAVTGGAVGSAYVGLRVGIGRGIFSNEAGMGTAPIAYSCAGGTPRELGALGILEVFVDTVIVCTLTALTVLCVGDIPYGTDLGAALTLSALTAVWGRGVVLLFCPAVCLFAFSSTVGWGLYGTRFVGYLWGSRAVQIFKTIFPLACIAGALFRADTVWLAAEIFNGLMALPNTFVLLMLSDSAQLNRVKS